MAFIMRPSRFAAGGATATGGTITESGGYRIHTFTSSGDFVVSGGSLDVEYLLVAGGGGGWMSHHLRSLSTTASAPRKAR